MTQGCGKRLFWKGAAAAILLLGARGVTVSNAGDLPGDVPAADSARQSAPDVSKPTIQRDFARLSDENPFVREEARQKLMSLSRKDLTTFRAVVKEHLPLDSAQAEVLRDIVTQVYLSEAYYPSDSTKGFLGVTSYTAIDEDPVYDLECGGVEIAQRIPGTCSFRCLEDGDVVLAVGSPPFLVEVVRWSDMSREIQKCRAGQTVVLRVLRRGRIIQVPVVLDAVPVGLVGFGAISNFVAQRRTEADAYWDETFEPLLAQVAQP